MSCYTLRNVEFSNLYRHWLRPPWPALAISTTSAVSESEPFIQH